LHSEYFHAGTAVGELRRPDVTGRNVLARLSLVL